MATNILISFIVGGIVVLSMFGCAGVLHLLFNSDRFKDYSVFFAAMFVFVACGLIGFAIVRPFGVQ